MGYVQREREIKAKRCTNEELISYNIQIPVK